MSEIEPEQVESGLRARLAELPREIAPPRDLWPNIAGRLRPQESEARPRAHFTGRHPWVLRAAAAVVFMLLGAALSNLLGSEPEDRRLPPAEALASTASQRTDGFQQVEAEYLRAKEALWLNVYSRYEEVPAAKIEVIRRNLVIIDGAIRDLRQALAMDPENRQLRSSLLNQHRRGIDLLQRLTA